MRFTAVFAVTLVAALFTVDGSASAMPLPTNNPAFINELLLTQDGGIINPQPASTTTGRDETPAEDAIETTPATPTEAAEPAPVIITVGKGDSLSKIAAAHNTTWVRLFDANESITDPNVINPGQEIRIPRDDETFTSRPLPTPRVATTTTTARTSTAPTNYPVSANAAKAFIYARESGNNPNATNPNGCYGLGQDCNGVLRTMCGADYACQDAFFDRYAAARYGSWEAAYAFWQANHWW